MTYALYLSRFGEDLQLVRVNSDSAYLIGCGHYACNRYGAVYDRYLIRRHDYQRDGSIYNLPRTIKREKTA